MSITLCEDPCICHGVCDLPEGACRPMRFFSWWSWVSGFVCMVGPHVVVLGDLRVSQGLEIQPCCSLAMGLGPNCLTQLTS